MMGTSDMPRYDGKHFIFFIRSIILLCLTVAMSILFFSVVSDVGSCCLLSPTPGLISPCTKLFYPFFTFLD